MSRIALVSALVLAACAAKPPAPAAFRATEAPIWSAAAFQPEQVAGNWLQAAAFQPSDAGCSIGALEIVPEAKGLRLSGTLCLAGRKEEISGTAPVVGPGRLRVNGEDWWVLWVDSGYRTLVIGTPSGRFGVILDRGPLPADRLEAAREIFDFNGYRTAALKTL